MVHSQDDLKLLVAKLTLNGLLSSCGKKKIAFQPKAEAPCSKAELGGGIASGDDGLNVDQR